MSYKKKILLVFGTRPEAIKVAPLYFELQKYQEFEVKILVTAQQRELLDQVLEFYSIEVDFDLNLMKPNQNLVDLTSSLLSACRDIYLDYKPDLVIVHGDTTTTFVASLAAFYCRIDVAHLEAGLRTFNFQSPYPEEMNRCFTTKLSKYHFAPTELSRINLVKENIKEDEILVTGNTVIDSLFLCLEKIQFKEESILKGLKYVPSHRKYVLITGHRRESFGKGFIDICEAIREVAKKYTDVDFVYPVHLNPNVQKPVLDILSNIKNVFLIEPLKYQCFVYLMNKSYFILTDSGGVQEEAPSLGKPVLVMRDTTERPEAVEAGTVKLVGNRKSRIVEAVSALLENELEYKKMACAHNPYGDGNASHRIAEFLLNNLF